MPNLRILEVKLVLAGALFSSACGGRVTYLEEDSSGWQPGEGPSQDDSPSEVVDCSGAFGPAEVLFEDPGWTPQALALTQDGLEIFYARNTKDSSLDNSRERNITVRRRAALDEPFGEAQPVDEMRLICGAIFPGTQLAALDVSGDGLRLYVGCNVFAGTSSEGPLIVARRPDRNSPFEVEPEPVGLVGYSVGLSRDELTAYGTSRLNNVDGVLLYQRSSIDEVFGAAQPLPGVPGLLNPEPAPGGLQLLAVDTTGGSHLVALDRSAVDEPFGPPSAEGLPVPGPKESDRSPALSADCRTLYFTRLGVTTGVMVAYR